MTDNKPFITIAIDGAAASGKSSTSRMIADKLNFMHVDTGAHYRAVTICLLQAGLQPDQTEAIKGFLDTVPLSTEVSGHRALIRINRYLPHETELRSVEVNETVSGFAQLPEVRAFLLDYQRNTIQEAKNYHFNGLIMEGRDIGSVVLPDADHRFFLFADPSTRSKRRQQEGQKDMIEKRDKIDSTRKHAPLKCPEGAIKIDTSERDLEAVVTFITETIGYA
tara:strand:+ start:45279 stop:45944 length:666 start_codon:yes stop_codon:yes gene_type:complete